jgi:hypothetical protein
MITTWGGGVFRGFERLRATLGWGGREGVLDEELGWQSPSEKRHVGFDGPLPRVISLVVVTAGAVRNGNDGRPPSPPISICLSAALMRLMLARNFSQRQLVVHPIPIDHIPRPIYSASA